MKSFLIANTHFGYKNNNEKWLNIMFDYFKNHFIPFIRKYSKEGDRIIHLGNLFNNSQNININILNQVQSLFEEISDIIPVYLMVGYNDKSSDIKSNDINSLNIFKGFGNIHIISKSTILDNVCCLPWTNNFNDLSTIKEKYILINFDYKKYSDNVKSLLKDKTVYSGFYNSHEEDNIRIVGSPYQLSEKNSSDVGFYAVENNKELWIKNDFSPKFTKIEINTEEDINNLDKDYVDNNFVDVVVNNELLDKNKTKIKFLLSKFKLNSIDYKEEEITYEIDSEDLNLEELIDNELKNVDQNIIDEFKNIMKIYDEF